MRFPWPVLLSVASACSAGERYGPGSPGGPTNEPGPSLCAVADAGRSLCVTEVQTDNDATLQIGAPGVFPDWFELTNTGSVEIDAALVVVIVGDEDRVALGGPPLAPGERRVVASDGLSKDGETVEVRLGDLLADRLDVPPLPGDTSWARQPDGTFALDCEPSPGDANGEAAPCADPREWVFEPGRIHDLWLALDDTAWGVLETSTTFDHPGAYGALGFAGGEFPVVQVELKGGYGSFRADLDAEKVAFKIDLDRVEDRRWHGLQKLTLNNMVQDPTFTHEVLTFELYRAAGLPAPRVGFARLHVDDVYFGLYALVEPVDGPFLDLWYADGSGHLLEAAYGPDFDVGEEGQFEYDQGPDEAAGRAAIAEVANLLATSPWDDATFALLDERVDLEQVMLNMAIEAATWNWDGYTTENNSYWYLDPTSGRFQLVPHGVDQTWVDGWPEAYEGNDRPVLYQFCLAVPACLALYEEQVYAAAAALDGAGLEASLDAVLGTTEAEWDADPRKEEVDERGWQLDATRERIRTAAAVLREAAAVNGP